MVMPTGTIKKLVSDRGFGFIKAEDGQEYFFHRSGTEGDLDGLQGVEKVQFEIETSPKGPSGSSGLFYWRRQRQTPPHSWEGARRAGGAGTANSSPLMGRWPAGP